jgi:hypothetical protein
VGNANTIETSDNQINGSNPLSIFEITPVTYACNSLSSRMRLSADACHLFLRFGFPADRGCVDRVRGSDSA